MKKCTHCGKEIEDSFFVCPYCRWHQSEKKPLREQELKNVRANNMQIFRNGLFISIVGFAMAAFVSFGLSWVEGPSYPDIGDNWEWLGLIIMLIFLVLPLAVVQSITYIIVSSHNNEISGLVLWLIYVFDFLVGIAPFILCGLVGR